MNKLIKNLILSIFVITIIKFILSLFITTPTIFSDEYVYIKMSQSFFQDLEFKIHEITTLNYPPLYPILLSITYFTNNVGYAYLLMKLLNALLTSLVIIPSYLITKEFLDQKKSLVTSVIISLMPMFFVFPGFIMAENLFYTLFLISLYFVYKSFTEKNYKYDVLAGIFIGLSFLTRFAGISLIVIVVIMLIYKIIKKEFSEINKKVVMGLISLVVVSPWFIRNGLLFGFTFKGIIGQYTIEVTKHVGNYFSNMFSWLFIYMGYLIIGSFFVYILAFSNLKEKFRDKKLKILTMITIITTIVILLGVAQHASKSGFKEKTDIPDLIGRPIGRYADTALPLIFILGLISYYKFREDKKNIRNILLLSIPFLIAGSQLLYFQLFPVNNISLSILGAFRLIMKNFFAVKIAVLVITIILLIKILFLLYIVKKYSLKKFRFITLIVAILTITNLTAYSAVIYNSQFHWENHPQIELSKWISKNIQDDKKILIDEDYCDNFNKTNKEVLCTKGKSTALTALWILNPVIINSVDGEYDYIITRKELNLSLAKKTENNIYLYKKS